MPKLPSDTYSKRAITYAKSVKSGKIPACWQVRAACDRFLNDFDRKDITYDVGRVTHVCEFAEALPHVIGPLAGELIELTPFQIFIFANLFGWLNVNTRLRRYREAFILLPRGNAKSTLAAIIGLYMTFMEGQGGAETLSGATSLKQAKAVFTPAKRMVEMSPDMADSLGIEVMASSIFQPSTGSSFQPVKAKTEDGGLPWCAIADELHQALDETQLNAFRTGMGKRRGADPMLIIISTAGTNVAGVCRQEQLYFENVLKGTVKDDSKFALIYTIDPTDRWQDFKVWKKANPNYGVSVDEDHLRREYETAKQSPSSQAKALTKYLNVWQNTATGWLNYGDWAKAAKPDLIVPPGTSGWIGGDLSTATDLTAITFLADMRDGTKAIIPFIFLPEGALERSKNAKAYAEWIDKGAIIKTAGSASDFVSVEECVRSLCQTYNVQGIAFDKYQANDLMNRLTKDGLPCVEFPQTAFVMHKPMQDFEADLLNGKIVHNDNPCMNWMAQNTSVKEVRSMNKPSKPTGQPHLKIDAMVAALMAHAQSTVEPEPIIDLTVEWFD